MITINTPWRQLGDLTYEQWIKATAGAPAVVQAPSTYQAAKPHTRLTYAMMKVESQLGTAFHLNRRENNNFLNLRPPNGDGYLRFDSVELGVKTYVDRITSPTYKDGIYARTVTILDLIAVFAPGSDSNDPTAYAAEVARLANQFGKDAPMPELRVILNPGHRNNTGGDPEERTFTPQLADAYFKAFSAAGYETVNLGDTNGGLDTACRRMVAQIESAAGECVLLDLHLEGGGPPGCFAIVPNITGLRTNAPVTQDSADTWENNTRDRALAHTITEFIAQRTYLNLRMSGVRESGVMDESQTGVGGDGFRLATFAYTSPFRQKAVRLVVEHGCHTTQPDRSIIFSPGFPDKCAAAAVAAVKAVYGAPGQKPGFATPAPITWKEGDVGLHEINGEPALAFRMEVEVTVGKVIPQVSESDARPAGLTRKKRTKLIAIGSKRDRTTGNAFVILRDKTRVPYKSVRPLVPLPPKAA